MHNLLDVIYEQEAMLVRGSKGKMVETIVGQT